MAVTNLETTAVGKGPWKWGPYVRANTKMSVPALLWTLHDLGGVIEDSSGRATTKLAKKAVEQGMAPHHSHYSGGALSQLMGELDTGRWAGTIERDCKARHTFKITLKLAPDEMPPRPYVRAATEPKAKARNLFVQPVADVVAEPEPEPEAGGTGPRPDDEPTPLPEPAPGPAPRPDDPNVGRVETIDVGPVVVGDEVIEPTLPPLVMLTDDDPIAKLLKIQSALNEATMDVIAMGVPVVHEVDTSDPEMANRLAATLEENNRLRAKVNTLQDTVTAKTKEADGYRKQVMTLQNNLRAIQEASNDSARRERDLARLNGNQRFISARPEPAIAGRR